MPKHRKKRQSTRAVQSVDTTEKSPSSAPGDAQVDKTRQISASVRVSKRHGTSASPESPVPWEGMTPWSISLPTREICLRERFVLQKIIGVGGMGVVYAAKDKRLSEVDSEAPPVALKLLNETFAALPEGPAVLAREYLQTRRLSHPFIIDVYDFDRSGTTVFMTMELLEGAPLDVCLRERPQEIRRRGRRIAADFLTALLFVHEQGQNHADVKTGNVFISRDFHVKLFDFGFMRPEGEVSSDPEGVAEPKGGRAAGEESGAASDNSEAGYWKAMTPAYASPQVLNGGAPRRADDIYAAGCVVYEILAGYHPFDRKSALEAQKLGLHPLRPKDMPLHIWLPLKAALAFTPESRIRSLKPLLHALQGRRISWLRLFGVTGGRKAAFWWRTLQRNLRTLFRRFLCPKPVL